MAAASKLTGVFRLQQVHDLRHQMDSIAAQFRTRAVCRFASGLKLEPQVALVRGDDLQPRRFADDGEIGLEPAFGQETRAALAALFIHQRDETNLRVGWPTLCRGKFDQRRKEYGDAALGVASAAALNPAVPQHRCELLIARHAPRVHVRREHDASANPAGR